MKKLTDVLSGIKNIFCRQQNSVVGTSADGVEFKDASQRTKGEEGVGVEGASRIYHRR